MANTPNQHPEWEDQWREAFDGVEVPPSSHVWKNIESQLAVRDTGRYRRGFLLYRAVAAALLLLIAGLSWYIITQQPEGNAPLSDTAVKSAPSAQQPPLSTEPNRSPQHNPSSTVGTPTDDTSPVEPTDTSEEPGGRVAFRPNPPVVPSPRILEKETSSEEPPAVAYQETVPLPSEKPSSVNSSKTTGLATNVITDQPQLSAKSLINQGKANSAGSTLVIRPRPETTGVSKMPITSVASRGVAEPPANSSLPWADNEPLYRVPQRPVRQAQRKSARRPSFFAGLAVAPGYFDPQLQSLAPPSATAFTLAGPSGAPGQNDEGVRNYASSVPPSSSGINDSPELSLTYGVDVGIKLFEHWVIESGIDYNRFSTRAETRWAVADVASGDRYPYLVANSYQLEQSNATPAPTTTTAINNAYQFISVPVQVGYQVAVKKLNFTLSSGVAANFFLGNDISALASPLANVRVSADEDGPFKSRYYSGVLSGGVNYSILTNYSFSLTPSYTFALTGLTRDESALRSQPYSFGINVGFQYQF